MNLEEFFRSRLPVSHGHDVREYLVGVLLGYVRELPSSEPLCLRLGDLSGRRVLVLKEVGDEALFLSGFLLRKEPSLDYYASIGSVAYAELADRLRDRLFRRLAQEFLAIQCSLRSVRREISREGCSPMDDVREWLQTRSEDSERALHRRGLLLS